MNISLDSLTIGHIVALSFFAWHYALVCGYISDDHAAVEGRHDIIPDAEKVDRGESFWVKRFNDGIVLFYQTRIFWKLGLQNAPFFWHLLSLTVHICNTYLVWLFLTPIMGEREAMAASAFWSISPMLNQNVVWISGRPYAISLFFALIGMICWDNPLVFMPYYFLAVVTNISIFFAPVILLLIHPESWQAKFYLAFMFVSAFPFLIWKFNKRFKNGLVIDRDNFKFRIRKVNTFARMVLYYVFTLFFPVRMGWYHQQGFRYNEKWEKFNYLTLIGYILTAFLISRGLGGWIFLLGILPNANIWATNSFLQDRYVYFCSIGTAMIVAPYLIQYPELFYIAMTFYTARTYMYSRHLKDDESLYRENWRNHPSSDFAINNLSYFLIQQRRYDESRVVIERGLHINRANRMLWYNLGITWAAQGHFMNDSGKLRFIEALNCWKTCLALDPRWNKPAEDIKKLVKLLVDNKVLTVNKDDSAPHGMTIDVPQIIGMKEEIEGT